MKSKIIIGPLSLMIIGSVMLSCDKAEDSSSTDGPESQITRNPVITPVSKLKAYYFDSPQYTDPAYYDSITYDQYNRVRHNIPHDKYTHKYYEDKVVVYYNWNNSYDDLRAYTYSLNDDGFPLEIKKDIEDSELYGPKKVKFAYAGDFISYKIIEWESSKDSIVYINNGLNIIQSLQYRDNQLKDQYYYEHDNKVNPFRGMILEIFSVEKFMNQNNITYEEWHTSTPSHFYIFITTYAYTYNSDNLPLTMTSTHIENNTSYINTFFYSYY